jgi:hypothetical protein
MTGRVLLIGAILVLAVAGVSADDVQPVQLQIRELPSGAFDVQWSVPKVIPPQAMPSPWMPDHCRPEGDSVFLDRPSAWMTRQSYRCPGGLAGQEVGIHHPGYNLVLSTLLRVELQTGDQYANMLYPGDDRWRVPAASGSGLSELYRQAQRASLAGIEHFLRSPIHLVFFAVVVLLGDLRIGLRLATAFFVGQVAGVVAASVTGLAFDSELGEIGVALATVLLARQALLPADDRSQLSPLAACAGVIHGLAAPGLVRTIAIGSGSEIPSALFAVLGMDATLVVSLAVVAAVRRTVHRPIPAGPWARVAVYGAAGVAVAAILGLMFNGAPVDAAQADGRAELPSLSAGSGTPVVPGSRRLAADTSEATIQSFVSIEAFEVRHEVLVKLGDLAPQLGLAPDGALAPEEQGAVAAAVRDLVAEHGGLTIDGEARAPASERVDFVTVGDTGVLPRPAPVTESIADARVGVTTVYTTPTTCNELVLQWDPVDGVPEIPATVTDPEATRSETLNATEPTLSWTNELEEDPVPRVTSTAVEPPVLLLPMASLAAVATALALGIAGIRRRRSAMAVASIRVTLAVALLVAPLANVAVALPASMGAAPGQRQVQRILSAVLPNIYRALEFREESAVFDRLALTITGDFLDEIYLEQRETLAMEERGGARARVETVEVVEVGDITTEPDGGFSANADWVVGGTVTHFGHRHFRQVRHLARIQMVAEDGIWKIRHVEFTEKKRLR